MVDVADLGNPARKNALRQIKPLPGSANQHRRCVIVKRSNGVAGCTCKSKLNEQVSNVNVHSLT